MRRFSVTSVPAAMTHSGADLAARQQDRAHADERVPADRPAVQDRPVADDHALLDRQRLAEVGVDDAAVLEVDARPQGDPRQVAAHDGAEPDVHPGREDHVAGHHRARGDVAVADLLHGNPPRKRPRHCIAAGRSGLVSGPGFLLSGGADSFGYDSRRAYGVFVVLVLFASAEPLGGLPWVILFAEMVVITLATLRTIFIARGMKALAPLLGFFEVSIWLFAIGEVMKNLADWRCSLAFAAGFTAGNFLGILIEQTLALGSVMVRTITPRDPAPLIASLRRPATA